MPLRPAHEGDLDTIIELIHALAEYELKAHTITPNRPLGEVLAG